MSTWDKPCTEKYQATCGCRREGRGYGIPTKLPCSPPFGYGNVPSGPVDGMGQEYDPARLPEEKQ